MTPNLHPQPQPTFLATVLAAFRSHRYTPPAPPHTKQPFSSTTDASSFEAAAATHRPTQSYPTTYPTYPSSAYPTTTYPNPTPARPTAIPYPAPRNPQAHGAPHRAPTPPQQQARTPSLTRRGSDASDQLGARAVREALGAQTWYVGGRTATGEEKYYKLGLVKRYDSRDRLSLDRLSL